mmetsp:Transcript_10206/g.30153  ORF Transcript_10206/g.30153 Transcript_10206/m.30153 type:complete len:269 (+) Transcript_10206:324-1130(+)
MTCHHDLGFGVANKFICAYLVLKSEDIGIIHTEEQIANAVEDPRILPISMTAGNCSVPSRIPAIDGGQAGQFTKLKDTPMLHISSDMALSKRLGTSDFHGMTASNTAHPARQKIPKNKVRFAVDTPRALSAYTSTLGPFGPLSSSFSWIASASIPYTNAPNSPPTIVMAEKGVPAPRAVHTMPGQAPDAAMPMPRIAPPSAGPEIHPRDTEVYIQSCRTCSNACTPKRAMTEKMSAPIPIAPKKTLSMTKRRKRNCPRMICGSYTCDL